MTATGDTPKPLSSRTVVVTRAREQAGALTDRLVELGATVLELPVIEIRSAPSGPIDAAIGRLHEYDWVAFTSVNGVDAFVERLKATGVGTDALSQAKVAVIGRGTASRLEALGVMPDFVPERFVAESVVEGMTALGIRGQRVLLPRADIARDTLPDGLRLAGAIVDVVVAYETVRPDDLDTRVVELIRDDKADVLTFASPSTVRNLASFLGDDRPPRTLVACIGPITAAAARESGFRVDIEAAEYSIPGLVEAVVTIAGNSCAGGVQPGEEGAK